MTFASLRGDPFRLAALALSQHFRPAAATATAHQAPRVSRRGWSSRSRRQARARWSAGGNAILAGLLSAGKDANANGVLDAAERAAIASSADGTKLLAAEQSGPLYTSRASLGSAGSMAGAQYEAIELQYTGGGVFAVLSYVGALIVR